MKRLGVGIWLTIEVFHPRNVFLGLLESYVRINVAWKAAATSAAPPSAAIAISAATSTAATAWAATAATTSISVLHSL